MKITPEKSVVKEWLTLLKEGKVSDSHKKLWRKIYDEIAVPERSRISVNTYKIAKLAKPGDNVIVPGKVLGNAHINHKITITALEYSESARAAIKGSECKILDINEFYNSIKGKKAKVNIIV
ncbi:MAG: 50S ribosomal protein L18e [Candidatus Marsarchaeota archaeon]|nr:50S ribosomal protein L18e [Candidatus Marsarchaeota archaeon]